ncbi:MAG TPA: hypothetical protein VK842_07190 [bacterium]|jgi:hypothetical protein|nr:hypothetical protein [bacterium]
MLFATLIFVHVFFGTLWAVGAFIVGFFVIPSVLEGGPGAGPVMGGIVLKRKFPIFMTLWAVLAVASGAGLWAIDFNAKGGFAWLGHPEGAVLTLASLGALHAFVKGLLVQKPTAEKMAALGARLAQAHGKPDPALLDEMKATQAKLGKVARSAAFELLGVAALMALHQVLAQF